MRVLTQNEQPSEHAPSRSGALSALRHWYVAHSPRHIPIAYKLAFIMTVLITGGLSVLGLVVINNQSEVLRHQANAFGQTVVLQLAESAKEPILAEDELALRVLINNLGSGEQLLGAAVYSETGRMLASLGLTPTGEIVSLYEDALRLDKRNHTFDWQWTNSLGLPDEAVSFLCPVEFKGLTVGHALVTFSRHDMVQSSREAKQAILIATLSLSLLAIIVAFLMGKQISRPVCDLVDASRAIGQGNFGYRFSERRNDELGTLMEAFNTMASSLLEKSQVERALSRYVSSNVAKQILENLEHVELGGQHVQATVLFADIVGFTRLSENMTPGEVADFLNEYFTYIAKVAELWNGTIDKFIGDCAMVVFGVPEQDADHRFHAIACAVMIRRLTERLNLIREEQGKPHVYFRIGVNTGPMLAGNMGSHDRMQYTVVGDSVNLASRLSSVAEKGEIVIRDEQYNDHDVKRRVIARRYKRIKVRGKEQPITVFRVKDVATTYRLAMEKQIDELLGERVTG